jgi:hypothetical protein
MERQNDRTLEQMEKLLGHKSRYKEIIRSIQHRDSSLLVGIECSFDGLVKRNQCTTYVVTNKLRNSEMNPDTFSRFLQKKN